MAQAQAGVAIYDHATFQADRAVMRFRSKKALPTVDGLLLKRQVLATKASAEELVAIDAAFDRLMAWAKSGAPVPSEAGQAPPSTPAQPQPAADDQAQETGAGEEDAAAVAALEAAWADELARQQARHVRRRSRYEAVRPQAPPRMN